MHTKCPEVLNHDHVHEQVSIHVSNGREVRTPAGKRVRLQSELSATNTPEHVEGR